MMADKSDAVSSPGSPLDLKFIALPVDCHELDVQTQLEHAFSASEGQPTTSPFRPSYNWPVQAVRSAVVGTQHIAFLFEDGTVGRIQYTLNEEVVSDTVVMCRTRDIVRSQQDRRNQHRREGATGDPAQTIDEACMPTSMDVPQFNSLDHRDLTTQPSGFESRASDHVPRLHAYSQHAGRHSARRGGRGLSRASVTARGRGRSAEARALMVRREHLRRMAQHQQRRARGPVLPASAVPEELVARVLEILPDTARSTIVRQLQRAHLDVDAAINALLASDDNDDDGEARDTAELESGSAMFLGMIDPGDHEGLFAHEEHDVMNSDDDYAPLSPSYGGNPASHVFGRSHPLYTALDPAVMLGEQSMMADADLAAMRDNSSDVSASSARLQEHSRATSGDSRKRRQSGLRTGSDGAKRAHTDRDIGTATSRTLGADGAASADGVTKRWGPVVFTGDLEMCSPQLRFSAIASMRSTLLLVDKVSGILWEAPWQAALDAAGVYRRAATVGLADVPVQRLFASAYRTIVLTTEGHLATIVDDCIAIPCDIDGDGSRHGGNVSAKSNVDSHKRSISDHNAADAVNDGTKPQTMCDSRLRFLEHSQRIVPAEYDMDEIAHVDVSSTMTCLHTVSGKMFWWGFLPLALRQELVKKNAKRRKAHMGAPHIRVGDVVQLKTAPLYRPGAIGFNPSVGAGGACVGKLLDTVWDLTDRCRFQPLRHFPTCTHGTSLHTMEDDATIVDWSLDKIVFLQQGNTAHRATVLKVDGAHAAVYFDSETPSDASVTVDDAFRWKHSRLFRTDELCHCSGSGTTVSRSISGNVNVPIAVLPDFLQTTPARIELGSAVVSGVAITETGFRIWANVETSHGDGREHELWNSRGQRRSTTRIQQHLVLEWDASGVLQVKDSSSFLPLVGDQVCPRMLRGGCGPAGAFQAVIDDRTKNLCTLMGGVGAKFRFMGRMRLLNVPPVHAVHSDMALQCTAATPVELVAVLGKRLSLFPMVLGGSRQQMEAFIKSVSPEQALHIVDERVDGNSNILHALVAKAYMHYSTSQETCPSRDGSVPATKTFLDAINDSKRSGGDTRRSSRHCDISPALESCAHELFCLKLLLADDTPLSPYRVRLLCHVDDIGRTPLMSALDSQQYSLASAMLGAIATVLTSSPDDVTALLCQGDNVSGRTPLHAAVAEGLCTYNYTGDVHVEQDVFQCHTCNIVDDMCICTACATGSHVGHDVRYKGKASAAFCDCGNTASLTLCAELWQHRYWVIQQLLRLGGGNSTEIPATTVLTASNRDGETVLHALVDEHALRKGMQAGQKAKPPNAAALQQEATLRDNVACALVQSWDAVKATLLIGASDLTLAQGDVTAQHDSAQLDHFTHLLLTCVDKIMFDHLVRTAQTALAKSGSVADNKNNPSHAVVARFVRSVVRVCCVYSSGDLPADGGSLVPATRSQSASDASHSYGHSHSRGWMASTSAQHELFVPESSLFQRVRHVFDAFPAIAVQELADNTDALLAPVVAGLVRPQASFKAKPSPTSSLSEHEAMVQRMEQARADARAAERGYAFGPRTGGRPGAARPSGTQSTSDGATNPKYVIGDNPSTIFSLFVKGMPPSPSVRRQWALSRAWIPDLIDTGSAVAALIPIAAPGTTSEDAAVPTNATDPSSASDTGTSMSGELTSAWALRQHVLASATRARPGPSATRVAAPERHARFSYRGAPVSAPAPNGDSGETEAKGKAYLCRLYGRLIKLMVDTAQRAWAAHATATSPRARRPSSTGHADPPTAASLRSATDVMVMQLERGWAWLSSVLDATEAQLRRGDLVLREDPLVMRARLQGETTTGAAEALPSQATAHPGPFSTQRQRDGDQAHGGAHVAGRSATDPARPVLGHGDFRTYALSLLRAHSSEHGDTVPVLDVSNTEYLAYLLDAFMYFVQSRSEAVPNLPTLPSAVRSAKPTCPPMHTGFFMRSESVAGSGRAFPALFATPMREALPLADRPDQLHPTSTKAMMFGSPRHAVAREDAHVGGGIHPTDGRATSVGSATNTPIRLSTSHRLTPVAETTVVPLGAYPAERTPAADPLLSPGASDAPDLRLVCITSGSALERWRKLINIFVHLCIESVGAERSSFMVQAAGYRVKELRFRDRMEKLVSTLPRSTDFRRVVFPRDPVKLLRAVHTSFANHLSAHKHQNHAFLCRAMKVEFENEPGAGSGVVRSFVAAVANGLLQEKHLPLTPSFEKTHPLLWKYAGSASEADPPLLHQHIAPLFHAPGKPGFMTPVLWGDERAHDSQLLDNKGTADRMDDVSPTTSATPGEQDLVDYRLSWFQNVGVLIGVSIVHGNIFPIRFSRHVLKYLLSRSIAWHDLAFFDPLMYESLRKTIVAATAGDGTAADTFAEWGLTFQIDKPPWLGGGTHDLVLRGDSIPVTGKNVHEYVALYAKYLMVDSVKPALDAMQKGLLLVLPAAAFDGLSAEDLRLILNGTSDVDVGLLRKVTTFKNETGKDEYFVEQTRKWFWSIVNEMQPAQRHDLVYFWTSLAGLPATEAGFVPKPLIVVRPPSEGNAGMLPTANTCSARLSIPVYPSIKVPANAGVCQAQAVHLKIAPRCTIPCDPLVHHGA
eukprot:m.39184 g.39184  ORF g.39184 m.39184 type:complete len:2594 (-) comp14703_c0_seq1:398-8179(-)